MIVISDSEFAELNKLIRDIAMENKANRYDLQLVKIGHEALEERNAKLESENKRLRVVLERFANEDNWIVGESNICYGMRGYTWGFDMDWPTKIALRALVPANSSDEERPA